MSVYKKNSFPSVFCKADGCVSVTFVQFLIKKFTCTLLG